MYNVESFLCVFAHLKAHCALPMLATYPTHTQMYTCTLFLSSSRIFSVIIACVWHN